ncbi:MAG TPA: hypothetical protein PLI95_13405, partial [Polyangiaceae bacterium]|nr:hypothetical protein [Polyangiaceae bacterium]
AGQAGGAMGGAAGAAGQATGGTAGAAGDATGGAAGQAVGGAAGAAGQATGGSGGGTTSCDNSGTCQTCAECSWQTGSCVDEYSSCANNTQCVGLWDCLGNCAAGDDTCVNNCATTYSAGVDPYVTLIDCTICTDCPVDCDGPGSGCGAGGSGGTGGSGGSGGSTQVCDDLATCAACKQCAVNGNCADELAACSASTACTTLQTCLAGCSNQGCINKCRNNNAGGTALYDALQGCNCTECSTACTAADGCP